MLIATLLLSALSAPIAPPAIVSPIGAQPPTGGSAIPWYDGSFSNALGKARSEDKLVCVYFWVNSSERCSEFFEKTLGEERAKKSLEGFVCVSANTAEAAGYKLVERFGVETLPSMVFVGEDGTGQDVIIGSIPADGLVAEVERIQRGENTVAHLRESVAEKPEDLERHAKLVRKLEDVGNYAAAQEARSAVLELDPRAESEIGASAHFVAIKLDTYAKKAESGELDLKPMYAFAKKVKSETMLGEVWEWLATGEAIRENSKAARQNYAQMWEFIPAAPEEGMGELSGLLNPGFELVNYYWETREELSGKERKLMLDVVERLARTCSDAGVHTEDEVWLHLDDVLARASYVNKKRSDAMEAMERCCQRAPDELRFKELLAMFQDKKS